MSEDGSNMHEDPREPFNRPGHTSHRAARGNDAGQTPRGELWALCDACERWYFVALEPALDVRSPRCPVCASVAFQLSLRVPAGDES